MALDDKVVLIAGLVEIEFVSETVRLCDGGFVDWPARGLFSSKHPDFGTIESLEAFAEAVNDEAPAGRLTLLPEENADAAELYQSESQGRPIRFWLAEVNRATGEIVGDPDMVFDGLIDFMTLRVGPRTRVVELEFISAAEKLFFVKEGNVLSTRFHTLAWPGEKGFDFCTGNQVQVPWGVKDPGGSSFTSILTQAFSR